MKKKILIVITLMVMCFTFAACGGSSGDSKSPYVGTWKAVSAGYGGMEMSVESVIGGEMTFELKADGKCILNVAGEEDSAEWTETEEGFLYAGTVPAWYSRSGRRLSMKRKVLTVLLILTMCFIFAGCGENNKDKGDKAKEP